MQKTGQSQSGLAGFDAVGRKITPTRCRYLCLKQIWLVNMIPAILIILTIHIIIAVRRMFIKILSVVIKGFWKVKTVKQ